MKILHFAAIFSIVGAAAVIAQPSEAPAKNRVFDGATNKTLEKIESYKARFGRRRPVIAVIGENSGAELTDFVIPYGVLSQSGVAEVLSVATEAGPLKLGRAVTVQPQATMSQFDAQFPDGADYVIVPYIVKSSNPTLLKWITSQSGKGSTIVSICLGAISVANTGLLDGHRATSYYAGEDERSVKYPKVRWERNIRYIADGKFVSSAGISASLPTSVALVEAIAGRDKAAPLAAKLGVTDWSSKHNSDVFQQPGGFGMKMDSGDIIGIPISEGVDEISVALTAEAYSHNGHSQAFTLSATADPVKTKGGLLIIPERVAGGPQPITRTLPALDSTPPVQVLDNALDDVAVSYGKKAAYGAGRMLEYPGFAKYR